MNLIFLFLVAMVFLIMAMSPSVSASVPAGLTPRSGLPSGLSYIDPKDDGAVDAAKYAVSLLFPSDKTAIEIVKARRRVVGSTFYDLDAIVTFTKDGTRSLHNFEVVSKTLRGKASPHTLTGYKVLHLEDEND